jgi:hypothetical protein
MKWNGKVKPVRRGIDRRDAKPDIILATFIEMGRGIELTEEECAAISEIL